MVTTDTGTATLSRGADELTLDTTSVRTARRERRSSADRTTRIKSSPIGSAAKWIILAVGSVVMLLPLYIMIISAFKSQEDILLNPLGFHEGSFTLDYTSSRVAVRSGTSRCCCCSCRVSSSPAR